MELTIEKSTLKNLPLEYVSVSQLNLYKSCPEKYKRKYIIKEPSSNFTNIENLLLGSAFDNYVSTRLQGDKEIIKNYTVNFFYWKLVELIKNDMLDIDKENSEGFLKAWDSLNYSVKDLNIEETKNLLIKVLTVKDYLRLIEGYDEELKSGFVKRPSFLQIYQNLINYYHANEELIIEEIEIEGIQEKIEYSFERYNKDVNLLGYLDLRGHYTNNENIFIRDWKISKKSKSIESIQSDQDLIYTWMVWKQTGQIPIFEYYYFIFSEKTGEIKHQFFLIQHSENTLNDFEKYIYEAIRGINQKVFYKNETSWLCSASYCEYYYNCQKYKSDIKIQEIGGEG